MEILTAPNPVLRKKTKPVKKITPELLKIAREMIKLTEDFTDPEGVGLSANQIGREENLCVVKLRKKFLICFNIKVLKSSKNKRTFFEGCLSVPDIYGEVKRPTSVTVSYQDENGKVITKPLSGVSAWILQHEIDHLNGKLFVDRILEQKGRVFKITGKDRAGSDIFEEIKLV